MLLFPGSMSGRVGSTVRSLIVRAYWGEAGSDFLGKGQSPFPVGF
jgi:hypothetical protein